jgi:hypothetical protein
VDATGFFLGSTMGPVFLRILWVNVAQDYVRVLGRYRLHLG